MLLGKGSGPVPYRRGEQQLPAWWRPEPLDRGDGPLVGDREGTDLLDLVAPELDPQRMLLGRREHVEDAAAYRELPALLDQIDARVRHLGQPPGGLTQIRRTTLAQLDRLQVTEALELRLEHRAHRSHEYPQRPSVRV